MGKDPAVTAASPRVEERRERGLFGRIPWGLFEPDVVVPAQVAALHHEKLKPEENLLLAIVELTFDDLQKYAFAKTARGRRLFQDAVDWFRSEDQSWPFSFGAICEHFRWSASAIRQAIDRWHDRELAWLAGLASEQPAPPPDPPVADPDVAPLTDAERRRLNELRASRAALPSTDELADRAEALIRARGLTRVRAEDLVDAGLLNGRRLGYDVARLVIERLVVRNVLAAPRGLNPDRVVITSAQEEGGNNGDL